MLDSAQGHQERNVGKTLLLPKFWKIEHSSGSVDTLVMHHCGGLKKSTVAALVKTKLLKYQYVTVNFFWVCGEL
jgi:hypothetical protein